MKKLVSIIALIMTMMVLSVSAYAFSNELYSVDVGEGFTEESLTDSLSLKSKEKDGYITFEVNRAVEGKDYFTQEELEAQKTVLIEKFKDKEFAIDKSEVQTFTSNNYRCVYLESHAKYNGKEVYFRQYLVYSGKYNYVITITTYKAETADTDAYKNVVNSFKVTDYNGKYDLKDPDQPKNGENKGGLPAGAIGGIVGGVVGGFGAFCVLKAKSKKK